MVTHSQRCTHFRKSHPISYGWLFCVCAAGACSDRRAGRCVWPNIEIRGRWEGERLKSAEFPTRTQEIFFDSVDGKCLLFISH